MCYLQLNNLLNRLSKRFPSFQSLGLELLWNFQVWAEKIYLYIAKSYCQVIVNIEKAFDSRDRGFLLVVLKKVALSNNFIDRIKILANQESSLLTAAVLHHISN